MNRYFILAVLLAAALAFSGCSVRAQGNSSQTPEVIVPSSSVAVSEAGDEPQPGTADPEPEPQTGSSYIDQVVQDTIAKFTEPGMSEYEKAKAAFDYMIETTHFLKPVGTELWRVRGNKDPLPSYVENHSLSILLYGIGECEDYAATLTMLLRGMDLEAEYVPGLTYAANGSGLVDHAWIIAKIDGIWYHLDVQLEDNISRRDTTKYKYFMRGDATMSGSHRWGQNLIDSRLLTAEQNEEIRENFLFEPCPQDYPTPAPRTFIGAPEPDRAAIEAEIAEEFREYEAAHEPLPPLELNLIPPVFGWEGYGPPD